MGRKLSFFKKPNCYEFDTATTSTIENQRQKKNIEQCSQSRSFWSIFQVLGRSTKLEKNSGRQTKCSLNELTVTDEVNNNMSSLHIQSLNSYQDNEENGSNPFVDNSESDLNTACTKSSAHHKVCFSRAVINKFNLQKYVAILTGLSKKKDDQSKKGGCKLKPATKFIVRDKQSDSSTNLKHLEVPSDVDVVRSMTASTNASQPDVCTAPKQNGGDENEHTEENVKRTEEDALRKEGSICNDTLDLLKSACERLTFHDFNLSGDSSEPNINLMGMNLENESETFSNVESVSFYENDSTASDLSKTVESCDEVETDVVKSENGGGAEVEDGDVKMEDGVVKVKLNTIQNVYASIDGFDFKEDVASPETQITYHLVEDDIKCMIKELLDESKTIKDTIISTGIEEERGPPFTCGDVGKVDSEVLEMCKKLIDDVVNRVTAAAHRTFAASNKKNIFTSKETTCSKALGDVRYIIDVLIEVALSSWNRKLRDEENSVAVNYCLVGEEPKNCSKIYSTLNEFRRLDKNSEICRQFLKLPQVTVNNLSRTPKVNVFKSDEELINRIKKSTALLLALYDEMRDYSYHTTSKLFTDLYETVNLLEKYELSRCVLPKRSISPPTNGNVESKTQSSDTLQNCCTAESKCGQAGTSCSKKCPTEEVDTAPSPVHSDSSMCSPDESHEAESSGILPNLKYTYQSDEEMNTDEEIAEIETNVTENERRKANACDSDEIDEDATSSSTYEDDSFDEDDIIF